MPNSWYIGQKLRKLVAAKITATTSSTMPSVPEIYPSVYKAAMIAATIKRIVLSVVPIFFFIVQKYCAKKSGRVTEVTFCYDINQICR
jgi:hypothetical protein